MSLTKTDILNQNSLDAAKKTLRKMIINKKYHERIGDRLTDLYNTINNDNFNELMENAHQLCHVIDDENFRIASHESFKFWGKVIFGGAGLYTVSKLFNVFFQQNKEMNTGQAWGIGVVVIGVIMMPFSWMKF